MAEYNYLFYDLETSGLDSKKSRPLEFSSIKTDSEFNIIDTNCIYSKLSLDVLPNPIAFKINGINMSTLNMYGVSEHKFADRIWEIFNEPNLLIGGFNNIHFDDEFIRNLFFRNFKNIYSREIKNKRFDVFILLKTVFYFDKDKYNWLELNDKTSFKLENFCKANGVEHVAHDSYTDTIATLEILKLIKNKSPLIFEHYFNYLDKSKISEYIEKSKTKIFYCNYKYNLDIIRVLAKDSIPNQYICGSLTKDLLDDKNTWSKNIFKLNINKCPFIKNIDIDLLNDTNKDIYKKISLNKDELVSYITSKEYPILNDPFNKIYEMNFKKYSNKNLETVHSMISFSKLFDDDILDSNLFRFLESKKSIKKMSQEYKDYCKNTILGNTDNCDINLDDFYKEIEKLDNQSELYSNLMNYYTYIKGVLNV